MTLIVLGGPARGARAGGAERYAGWLQAASAEWVLPRAVRFAAKARLGGEVVRTADGVSAAWVHACGRSRLRWWHHVARERRAVRRARKVVAISPMVAAELARWYGRHDACLLLNPVFAEPAPPEPRAAGALVFVGHGFRRKGLDRLLEVAPRLGRPVHVIGHDRHVQRWRRLAGPWACFHGPRPAAGWIGGAAVLVHPARYEPYGNVVAEAVRAGTPAVVSDATGAACLLDPRHVWAQRSGAEGLFAAIEGALRSPRPPRQRPPTAEAHLAQLRALLES